MDFAQLYDFLFNSYLGIAVLVGAGLVISILVCVILEVRTRKIYKNHERTDKDAWSIFEDDDEEDAAPAPAAAKQGGKKLNTKAVTGKTQTARAATVMPKKVVKKQASAGAQAACASTDAGANGGAE